jgi:predicted ATP-grasp superfamily ATP-dependent carboligase
MNTRDKVEYSKYTPVRVNQCHKVQGYDNHDKIEIPVLFGLTKECERVYDRETMTDYLNDILNSIEEHEKNYKNI